MKNYAIGRLDIGNTGGIRAIWCLMAWSLVISGAEVETANGVVSGTRPSEGTTRDVLTEYDHLLAQFEKFGKIADRLPSETVQEMIYRNWMRPYAWACALPKGLADGPADTFLKKNQSYLDDGHEGQGYLASVHPRLLIYWIQHLPPQTIRSFMRIAGPRRSQAYDLTYQSKAPNFLDMITEYSGVAQHGGTGLKLFLAQARALALVKLIRPCLARTLDCPVDMVEATLDETYGSNLSQAPSWSQYQDFYPVFPVFDYAMRASTNQLFRDDLFVRWTGVNRYIDTCIKTAARRAQVVLKSPEEIMKSPLRCISQGLPRSFFQAINEFLAPHEAQFDAMSMDLYGKYFPAGVTECTGKLTELTMTGLDAYTLPKAVGNLINLKKLSLQGKLYTIPEEITKLTLLQGEGSLKLPALKQLEHTANLQNFLVNQTKALTPKEYALLAGQEEAILPSVPNNEYKAEKLSWADRLKRVMLRLGHKQRPK